MRRISLLILLLATQQLTSGQSFKFKKYLEQDGLNNRFVYTIDQDEAGNLMIGTGEGLYKYDGFTFEEYNDLNATSDNFLTCSAKSYDGSIWYGHNKGLISQYRKGAFEHFDLSSFTQSKISAIQVDNQHNLWVLTQNDGILLKDEKGSWKQYSKGIEEFTLYTFHVDEKQRIWLGTDVGLLVAHVSNSNEIIYEWVDEIVETKVSSICEDKSGLYIGTDDAGIFKINFTPKNFDVLSLTHLGKTFANYSVNSLFVDDENNLWICTNKEGLLQLAGLVDGQYLKLIRYNDNSIMKSSSMRICREDREGTIWIGTLGDGLLKLTDNYFSIFSFQQENDLKGIYSVFEKKDTIWSGGFGSVFVSFEDPSNVIDTLTTKNGLPKSEITSIHQESNGTLWVGTMTGEILKLSPGSRKFINLALSTNTQHQKINDILGFNETIYIATDYGIYQFSNDKLISHISIQSGLSHNVIKSLFRDTKGKIWIATNNSQITYIEDGVIHNIPAPLADMLIQIRCFAEDNTGNIWIGTDGLGLMKVTGNDILILNKNNGLYSDYCYSMTCDHRNKLWVGHHGALSQVNVLNNQIEIHDPGQGLDTRFNDNAVDRMPSGIILFGINDGLLRYEPSKDVKNDKEPLLHFRSIQINDSLYSSIENISLPYGEFKLVFKFIGVSLKNPVKVNYQYYLEGYESEWNELTTTSIKDYGKIGPGDYIFKVKCFNSDGFGGTTILECKISIDKPVWLKWWFIATCILSTLLLVRFIILRRERYLRENQERLKQALDERTKEVVEQKELLEEKNKDITASIQYARNIQKAMLPPIDSLKTYFEDAFVYYKPRDIVSGDFYWVEKYESTIVVSCADCTGHGVPGAFMSLIGSTLLKEVSSKKVVQSSKDVLIHLDSELSRMLNKQESVAIEDGMDISVFDYNIETRILKMASANRPILFHHKGEWLELKGDRLSIGGSSLTENKVFSLYEFTVVPGDAIYMFSDGITDQFGGENGKKLKRSGLYNWIKATHGKKMDEQRTNIRNNFHSWKGELEQIDDIIVIGIKF